LTLHLFAQKSSVNGFFFTKLGTNLERS